jgi:hypothetical protein
VRWTDVSYEPMMDVPFMIAEFKRLLSRPLPSSPSKMHETAGAD